MNIKTYSLFKYIKGQWFLQENYYSLNKKEQQNKKKKFSFLSKLSNLNRQIIFNSTDIGKLKVAQAKKVLNKINY